MAEHTDIVMHVKLLDKFRLQQQETLGVLGVNLVHTAFFSLKKPENIISSLVENIKPGQVFIDYIRVSGANADHVNNHLLNLELVRTGLTEAILFSPQNIILDISDNVWDRPIIVERGTFKSSTAPYLEILEKGVKKFKSEFSKNEKNPLALFEITMHSLKEQGPAKDKDFLKRVQTLTASGQHVLVSNFFLFYRLKKFLRQYTQRPIAMIVGANLLSKLFDESFYKDLEGRLLEGLGRLMDSTTHLYIYPSRQVTSKTFKPPEEIRHIYDHFIAQGWMSDIEKP